ncbi:MAG TPA: beta-hexosaminidase, partial [Phenylobacterium sp.]|nr:beta-hexosaminidase [Phenylobacterium sp.]
KALAGGFRERAEASLAAGCDVVLHCNGDMAEMKGVVAGTRTLKGRAARRAAAALARLPKAAEPFDAAEGRARFDAAFGGEWAG